ncbi:NADH oxidase [Streptomyces sp. NPDC058486]|uniref:NADH oxidase n=1 Tax=unclassified Streptomyces TaxID=2593676 RepID=UPI003660AA04
MQGTSGDARTLHLWSLAEDVSVEQDPRGDVLFLTSRWGRDRIDRPGPVVREVLRRMELGPVLLGNAMSGVEDLCHHTLPVLARLSHLVVRTLGLDDLKGPLLSLLPASSSTTPLVLLRPFGERRIRLPQDVGFSVAEPGSGCVMEHDDCPYRVVLHRPEAAWVAMTLAWPTTLTAVSHALPLPPKVTRDIVGYLAAASLVTPVHRAEDGEPA